MTMPDERTRSLLQTGAFLKELSRDPSVPRGIREEAARLLRHYPTVNTVRLLACLEDKQADAHLLTTDIDASWLDGYRFGAHSP